jgi:hypothetical protein
MDFLGPIKPVSTNGNKYVLVMTDAFSKWTEVVALPNQTAETTCRALMDKIILYHGPPKIIVTDRGTNFTSRLFNNLCNELQTKHKTTTAYHPQSNGMTERFNKTVIDMVRKYVDDELENWEEVLGPMAAAYRNSVHASTMESPYFLITARDPNMVVDRFLIPESESITPRDYKSQTMRRLREGFQLAKENLLEARRQQKAQYDKRAKKEKFEVGDRVLLDVRVTKLGTSKKLNPRYQGPFRVSKVFPNHTVEIRAYNGNGTQLTHVNRLKALTECMIWRDEECVDFDDLRQSKLTNARQRDGDSDDEGSSDQEDEEDEFNDSDSEEDDISPNLDAVMNADQDADLINFDASIAPNPAMPTHGEPLYDANVPEQMTLPPPLTPQRVAPALAERNITNEGARPKRATRLPNRFRDFLLD